MNKNALKYFGEDALDYVVVAARSLFGGVEFRLGIDIIPEK